MPVNPALAPASLMVAVRRTAVVHSLALVISQQLTLPALHVELGHKVPQPQQPSKAPLLSLNLSHLPVHAEAEITFQGISTLKSTVISTRPQSVCLFSS